MPSQKPKNLDSQLEMELYRLDEPCMNPRYVRMTMREMVRKVVLRRDDTEPDKPAKKKE